MWKKIIIGSVVLFAASSYFFFANNDAMTAAEGGEIVTIQQNLSASVEKSKELNIDRFVKVYSEMRTEKFNRMREDFIQQKNELDAESAARREETAELTTTFETAEAEYKRLREELNALINDAADAVGISADSDTTEAMREVAEKIAELLSENGALEQEIAKEEATIAALGAESERLLGLIAAGKKLNQDRQARISPASLDCKVLTTDPQWDYVILDAGIDKGIVIGSRLAVMRGDVKICELNVTLVENSRASCDVVYSTLLAGEHVHVGDKVVAAQDK